MELVIRAPRMKRAFEFKKKAIKKREYQKREHQQREMKVIETKAATGFDFMGTVARYDMDMDMNVKIDTGPVEVLEPIKIDLGSTREPEKQISMKDEMISLDDLDTGQYKAMIIQDPSNKKDIQGFIYIATAWGTQLRPPDGLRRANLNLVEAINKFTKIKAQPDNQLYLDDRRLLDMPFVLIVADDTFELTEPERINLEKYLRNGGFIVVDNANPETVFGKAEASLRKMIRDALGADAKFIPIPNDHAIYRCFEEFPDGPPVGSELKLARSAENTGQGREALSAMLPEQVLNLEGIWLGDRLVAVYSDKGYSNIWKEYSDNETQLRMGINFVVYALTQEGSIAQQKMDMFSSAN
jgi:hypothetical protein